MKSQLIQVELNYAKCFAEVQEEEKIIGFTDLEIADMYTHNFLYLTESISQEEYCVLVEREIEKAKLANKNFLDLQFDFDCRTLQDVLNKENQSTYAYYQIQCEEMEKLLVREDVSIQKLEAAHYEEALAFDLEVNGEEIGYDFIKRRFERRSKVYLQQGLVDQYLCSFQGKIIGHCDLFIDGEVAKLEDFDIAPFMRRQGFCSALLKSLSQIAKSQGAKMVYVITDDEDTAKEMYEKCGMQRIGNKYEVLYHF